MLSDSQPVESSEPVQRHHELENVGPEQDVVADSLGSLGHEVAAVQGPDEQSNVDKDRLHQVEHVQCGQGEPFLFLKNGFASQAPPDEFTALDEKPDEVYMVVSFAEKSCKLKCNGLFSRPVLPATG